MKKLRNVVLALIFTVIITVGCSAETNDNSSPTGSSPQQSLDLAIGTEDSQENRTDNEASELSVTEEQSEGQSKPTNASSKTLVVYYSATNTTERIANMIADYQNADVFKIEPVEPYTSDDLDWTNSDSRVCREHDTPDTRHVELTTTTVENFDSYDVIYIGYPIWWQKAAWVVDDFIKNNDFSGKTVIPFCTFSTSPLGESGTALAEMAGTGNWLEGMRFSGGADENEIKVWLDGINNANE